jgi:hypothetical protein
VNESYQPSAIIPIVYINSWLTGKRAISLPFSDFCEPLFSTDFDSKDLINSVIHTCKKDGMKSLEFRASKPGFPFQSQKFRTDFRQTLKLNKNENELLKSFSENTRRNIKKAAKEKLTLQIINDFSGLKLFYEMMCETRKKHGLPPQPFSFFNNIFKLIISTGHGDILFAVKDNTHIASAIYFKFGKKLLYKFGASYSDYYDLRGNNFVMWEAIKKYTLEGFEEFDFGRTETENEGLRRFKLGWNAEESLIYTTRYDLRKNAFLSASTKTHGIHNTIFNRSPIILLKLIGNTLYKHIG